MSRLPPITAMMAAALLAGGMLTHGTARARAATPDSAPDSEVTSGQRVTGHHHTHKSKYGKTSPEQPAPATAQKIPPSQRLPDEPNQVKDQVAPIPDAPVKPGTGVSPGQDTPAPH